MQGKEPKYMPRVLIHNKYKHLYMHEVHWFMSFLSPQSKLLHIIEYETNEKEVSEFSGRNHFTSFM